MRGSLIVALRSQARMRGVLGRRRFLREVRLEVLRLEETVGRVFGSETVLSALLMVRQHTRPVPVNQAHVQAQPVVAVWKTG